jgi:hypothetical protein
MLEINNEWALEADELNITLLHRGKSRTAGRMGAWTKEGFYSSLHAAMMGLVRQEVRDTDLASLKDVLARIDELHRLIKGLPDITVASIQRERKEMSADTKAKIRLAKGLPPKEPFLGVINGDEED